MQYALHREKNAKQQKFLLKRTLPLEVPEEQNPDQQAQHQQLRQAILDKIEDLSPQQRDCLQLRLEDYKYREIATILDMPIATVKSRLFLARRHLREKLLNEFFDGSDNVEAEHNLLSHTLPAGGSRDSDHVLDVVAVDDLASGTREDLLDSYLSDTKTKSGSTTRAYRRQIRRFLQLAQVESPRDVKETHLKRFRERLLELKLSGATKAQALSAVRSFLHWFREQTQTGPSEQIIQRYLTLPPAPKESIPAILSDEEAASLSEATTTVRDAALVSLVLDAGLKLSEVVRLRPRDFVSSPNGHTVRLSDGREITLDNQKMRERIQPLLDSVLKKRNEDAYLFAAQDRAAPKRSEFQRPLSTRGARKLVGRVMRSAGIEEEKVSPHTLRNTFSARYLSQGGHVEALQKRLGYQSKTAADRYAKGLRRSLAATA